MARSPFRFAERIAHLDMDAFFVEVERRRDPALRGRPVLVGGTGPRSVVASASYEARRRGASSAMPMAQARRLVPGAVVVPPDRAAYRAASGEVFAVLEEFTPRIEPMSVDEAFLDIGGLRLHHESPAAAAGAIRAAIGERTSLPCSIGVATSKLLAKMASRDAKPNGMLLVGAGTELEYLHPKPVRALWGVGEATHARLEELGVSTVGDLADYPRQALERRLGVAVGGSLWELANGRDGRAVEVDDPTRSVSVEETFAEDIVDTAEMERALLAQADRLAGRLRRAGFAAQSITLKVRYPDFATVTRSQTFGEPVISSAQIIATARHLLGRTAAAERGVRLLGVGASGLVPADAPRQLGIDDGPWEEVDRAVADVRDRFGADSVGRAVLRPSPSPPEEGPSSF